jgi:hypothetical protein
MTTIQPQTATERATLIALKLASGQRLRTNDVAALCGITRRAAAAGQWRMAIAEG